MSKTIISEGKTTNEAIENGLKELKVSKNEVEIKVLENEDKRSFFSILAPRVVKVELTLKEDNKTNKSSIDVLEKSNETRDEKISKNVEDIEAIQRSIKAATETINKKDNEQEAEFFKDLFKYYKSTVFQS